ncbi:hypothetical protein [Ascidiimonas sp. W6]|uniref:hypothetical protein n=1 Tax=Ascidiimonas meishanensis TaxID=3128903 RepID=UPI0030EC35E2
MTNNYKVYTYQSIAPELIQNFSQTLHLILLNGLKVKKKESSFIINPITGHFQYSLSKTSALGSVPQSEEDAKQQLLNLMNTISQNIAQLAEMGRLPEGVKRMFNADYFKLHSISPSYHHTQKNRIVNWVANYIVQLPAVENSSLKLKTSSVANEGFQVTFSAGIIEQLKYTHLPIIKENQEELLESLNPNGNQKVGVFYARNRDHEVLPFYITNLGALPATTSSVLLEDDPIHVTNAANVQFPVPQKKVVFPPDDGDANINLIPNYFAQMAPNGDCVAFGFLLAFHIWCIEARRAIRYFADGLSRCEDLDSLDETISGWVIGESLESLAANYPLSASFFMELFHHFKAHAKNKGNSMKIQTIVTLWESKIDAFMADSSKFKKANDRFVQRFSGKSQKEIQDYLLLIVKGTTGLEGLPSATEIKRSMVAWWVNSASGERGKIVWSINLREARVNGRIVETITSNDKPSLENVAKEDQILRMILELWKNTAIIRLPFDMRLTVTIYSMPEEAPDDIGYVGTAAWRLMNFYDSFGTDVTGNRNQGWWTGEAGIDWNLLRNDLRIRQLTVSLFNKN